jgi:EAL domain-containing protein (putative c-di-GMP-specific phosphodiesterase class I)
MCGAKALVRWHRPAHELVGPDAFINEIERLGLTNEVGAWVLETACRQAASWLNHDESPLSIVMNISASRFESPGFLKTVNDDLGRTGILPERLGIEVTESITRNPNNYARGCHSLQLHCVRPAINGFDAGYSSFSVLKDMRVNTLKLDRQFVLGVATDTASATMV